MASIGYEGTVGESQWARLHPDYYVDGPAAWKVTSKTDADRSVVVAAGTGYGYGVRDEDMPQTVLGPAPVVSAGSRWDTVFMRRNWQPSGGGTSAFGLVTGSSTKAIAGTRKHNPGVEDDQPIALVRFAAGQTLPQEIIDLRVWRGLGGGLLAADSAALEYLTEPGTTVTIGSTEWVRVINFSTGTAAWEARRVGHFTARATSPAMSGDAYGGQPLQMITGQAYITTNSNGDYAVVFPSGGFPNGLMSVQASLVGAIGVGAPAQAFTVLYDRSSAQASARPTKAHFFGRVFLGVGAGVGTPYSGGAFGISYTAWGW